jgi:hypothetical protein
VSLVQIKPTVPSSVYPKTWDFKEDDQSLLELVLKFVYCETLPLKADNGEDIPLRARTFRLQDEVQMKFSIDYWYKAVLKIRDRKIHLFKATVDELGPDEVHMALMRYSSLIRKKENKNPLLMRRLQIYKVQRVDYRKVYKLPGAHQPSDFERGARIINAWNEKNPDLS